MSAKGVCTRVDTCKCIILEFPIYGSCPYTPPSYSQCILPLSDCLPSSSFPCRSPIRSDLLTPHCYITCILHLYITRVLHLYITPVFCLYITCKLQLYITGILCLYITSYLIKLIVTVPPKATFFKLCDSKGLFFFSYSSFQLQIPLKYELSVIITSSRRFC